MIALLTSRPVLIGAACLAVLLSAFTTSKWLYETGQRDAAEDALQVASAELKTVRDDLRTCRASTANLQASLEAQNIAAEAAAADLRSREAAAKREAQRATAEAQDAGVRAALILNAKPTGDLCVAALDLARGG